MICFPVIVERTQTCPIVPL